MAQQLTFGQFATSLPVQEFAQEGAFELDQEVLEQRRQLFKDEAKRSVKLAFKDWINLKKEKGWGDVTPVDYDDYDDLAESADRAVPVRAAGTASSGVGDVVPDSIMLDMGFDPKAVTKTDKDFWAWRDFQDFWKERNRARIETLNPVFLQAELEQGGVDLSHSAPKRIGHDNPALDVFLKSTIQAATLDVINTDSPIYQGRYKQYYGKSNLAGQTLGGIMSLMALTYAAQGIGATTKVAAALKKFKTAERWARITGYLPATMRRSKSIVNGLSALNRGIGLTRAGVAGRFGAGTALGRAALRQSAGAVTSGLIFGFADTTRGMASQFIREDKLERSAWEKLNAANPIRSAFFGFLKGVGINVINAPSSWGIRFVADAMWSTAQQGANVISGGEWDNKQFVYDWIVSHAIGERSQMLNTVIRSATPSHPLIRIRNKMRKISPDYRSLSDDKQIEVAIWAQGAVSKLNQPFTGDVAKGVSKELFGSRRSARAQEDIVIDAAKIFTAKHKEMASIIDRAKYENYIDVDALELGPKELNINRRQMALEVAKIMRMTPEQAEHLINSDSMLSPGHLLQAMKDLKLQKQTAPELVNKFVNVKREQLIKKVADLERALEGAPEGPERADARLEYLEAKEQLANTPSELQSTVRGISDGDFIEQLYRAMNTHAKGTSKKAEAAAFRKILNRPADKIIEFFLPNSQKLYRAKKPAVPPFKPTATQAETIGRIRGLFQDDLFVRDQLAKTISFLRSKFPEGRYGSTAQDMSQNVFLRLLSEKGYSDKRIAHDIDVWKQTHPDFDFNNPIHLKEITSNIIKNNAFNSLRDRRALKGEFRYLKKEAPADFRVDQQTVQEYDEGVWVDKNTGEMTSRPDQVTAQDEPFFERAKSRAKFWAQAKSTKERIKSAGKDAKDTGGIDLSSLNNKDFAVMAEIARRDPANIVNTLIRYWDDALGMKHDEIREHLSNYGISRTPKNIDQTYGKMLPSGHHWKSALTRLNEPFKTTVRTSRRVSYNLRDAEILHRRAQEIVGTVNPRTGIKASLESPLVRSYASRNGLMVIGIKDYTDSMSRIYIPSNIERLKAAAGEFIKNEVAKLNQSYVGQEGNPKIILRHPESNNGTDFVITGYNIDPADFKGAAIDIYNRLTNRYPQTPENIAKAFAVKLMGNPINKIPNATLSFTKDLNEIDTISRKHLVFNRLLQEVSPKQFARTEDILLNMDNPTVRVAVNAATKAGDVEFAERRVRDIAEDPSLVVPGNKKEQVQAIIDNSIVLDNVKPAIRLAEEQAQTDRILGRKPREQAVIKNQIKSSDSEITPDQELRNNRDYNDDETGILKFMDAGDEFVLERARAAALEVQRLEERGVSFDGLGQKLKEKIRSITSPIDDVIKGKFSIFEDILKIEPTSRQIVHTMGKKETASKDKVREIEDNIYGKFYKKYGLPFIKGSRVKDPLIKNRLEVFNKLQDRLSETELKPLSEQGDIRPGNALRGSGDIPSARDQANEPITNGDKIEHLIQKVINDPDELTDGLIANMRSLSKDKLLYTKIAVQKLKMPFEDVYDVLSRSQTLGWDIIDEIGRKLEMPPGAYRKNALVDSINQESYKRYAGFFQRYGELAGIPKEQAQADFFEELFTKEDSIQAAKKVAQMANAVRDEYEEAGLINDDFSDRFNRIVATTRSILTNDQDNFLYRHHAVLADPDNNEFYGSRLNKMVEEGRLDVGKGAMDPTLYDVHGRKHRTLDDLSTMGFKTINDARANLRGALNYMFTRQINYELGRGWKTGFIDHTEVVLSQLKQLHANYDEVKQNVKGYSTEEQIKRLRGILTEIDKIKNDTIAGWGEHNGVVYVDNTKDRTIWQTRMEDIEVLQKEDITDAAKKKLDTEFAQLQRFMTISQDIHDFTTGRIFTQKKRDFLNTFKGTEGLDAATIKDLETKLDAQEQKDRGLINDSLFDAALGEVYMPVNAKVHNRDSHSDKFSAGRAYIYGKPLRWKPNRITSPNLPGYEGLYLHRALHKGLQQFVFRYDYEDKAGSLAALKKGQEVYDGLNRTMKTLSFWKPTIVGANDLAQGLLATGPGFILEIPNAWRIWHSRNDVGSSVEKKAYQSYRERNLFHHTLGFNGLVTDAVRDYSRMVGDGMAGTIARSLFAGDNTVARGKVRKVLRKMMQSFHQYQNITWSIDEIMRISVAERFRKRFYPIQLKRAKERRVQNPEAAALDESLWLATERTNMFMADYSRVPDHMRRAMNRFMFVPTFKIAQTRMYKNMIKEFGQGVQSLFRGIPENQRGAVSDQKIEQAMFMMAPLIRKVIFSAAIKGIVYGVMGYNFQDKLDMIKGYRARRIEDPDDPMSSMIRTLSLSTPMFEMEKFFGRLGTGLNLRYNMAALPGLMFSIATNKDRITGQRIWGYDDDVRTRSGKLGLHILRSFFPIGSDISNLPRDDLETMARVVNLSGLGYFYQTDSPNKLLELFYDSINKSNTLGERRNALMEFNRGIQRVNAMLLDEKFRSFYDELEDFRKSRLENEI